MEKTYKYNCPECTKGTDNKTEYTVHMDRYQMLKDTNAMSVTRHFSPSRTSQIILRHFCVVASGTTSHQFECSVCGQVLKTEDRYREHFKWQHVDNKHPKPFFASFAFQECGLLKGSKNTWIYVKVEVIPIQTVPTLFNTKVETIHTTWCNYLLWFVLFMIPVVTTCT